MKKKFHLFAMAGIVLLASCKNSTSEKDEVNDSTATVTTSTTDNAKVEAPAAAKTSFESKYQGATNVRWQYHRPDLYKFEWDWSGWPALDESDYAVNYNWNGADYWAWYDQDGNWIGTVTNVSDHSSLPAAVNKTVQAQFAGKTIESIDMENDKDKTAYEIKFNDGSKALIDANGNIMKKKDAATGEEVKKDQ